MQDPQFSVTKHWELEAAIFLRTNGKQLQFAILDEEWTCKQAIKSASVLQIPSHLDFTIKVTVLGTPIMSLYTLRKAVMEQEYKEWLRTKCNWSKATFNSIMWHCLCGAIRKFQGHQNSIRRFIHGWLPVADLISCYNEQEIKKCPWCNRIKRQDHILRCPQTEAQNIRHQEFENFWKRQQKDTEPWLLHTLKLHLKCWTLNPAYKATRHGDPLLHAACQQQNAIGWTNFTRG